MTGYSLCTFQSLFLIVNEVPGGMPCNVIGDYVVAMQCSVVATKRRVVAMKFYQRFRTGNYWNWLVFVLNSF